MKKEAPDREVWEFPQLRLWGRCQMEEASALLDEPPLAALRDTE